MAKRKETIEYREGKPREAVLHDAAVAYHPAAEDEADALRGTTRLSGKNQITLPVAMVRALGWRAGDEVDLLIDQGEIWLRRRLQGRAMLDRLEGALGGMPEWSTRERIDGWMRGERDSWDRDWDSDKTPSKSDSPD